MASKDNKKLFKVSTIAETKDVICTTNNLKIVPEYSFEDDFEIDILIIPGGYGAEKIEIKNKITLNWITKQSKKVSMLASVCTGALLLAECGLLNYKKATTHWMDLKRLENDYPLVNVILDVKYVDEEEIITSCGISAGINMSFYIVKKLFGAKIAQETAKRMEYDILL